MTKKIRNKIDGVLLLDKPLGLSSNQAIQRVKRILNAEKVGHTGTLDPLATGLLPVCLGEATKFANYLLDGDKEYLALAQLGVITASGDSEGAVLAHNPVNTDLMAIEAALKQFCGQIWQTPPMYSALKHNGQPLYEYARQGIAIERPARAVTIHKIVLEKYDPHSQQIEFRATVSKGTYIRTLAEDIGALLGCGASLLALRRLQTNQFNLSAASSLEELEKQAEMGAVQVLPIDVLVDELPEHQISVGDFSVLKYGNLLAVSAAPVELEQDLRLYANQHFIGVGSFRLENQQLWLCPKRLMAGLATVQPWP